MAVILALLGVLFCSPARAVNLEGPPVEGPQIPALPTPVGALLPTQAVAPIELSAGTLNASAAASEALSSPLQAAEAARSGANPAQAQSAQAEAAAVVEGVSRKGGAEIALSTVFDGNFKKGSIEDRLVAPMPGRDGSIDLSRIATDDAGGVSRKKAEKKLESDKAKLDKYEQKIFADKKNKILIVLQGMDTGGKDGIIKHVLKGLSPQGMKVTGFKKPTEEEAKNGPMWRIKKALGGPGMISVFNRSHYEDALVPMAKKTMTQAEIDQRIADINKFEKDLVDDGWTVVKLFLHVSKEENWNRLEERRTTKKKQWKLSPDDLVSREHWQDNQDAYSYVIGRTNTPYAPWFVIPSDKKWYRNYAAGRIIKRALKRLRPRWPKPASLPKKIPK